ncbi:MAG: hypothetical protein IT521_02520 [Burkholderiales bacterium]|nr:hypothetical protein [Burkholderiales bacterium]
MLAGANAFNRRGHGTIWLRKLAAAPTLFLCSAIVLGQNAEHPLKPPDRSSPHAALKTFLEASDLVAAYLSRDYLPSPPYERARRLPSLASVAVQSLDLSNVPPAARMKTGGAAVQEWREQGALPFPNFSPEQAGRIRGSVVCPPAGTTAASLGR